MNHPNDAVFPSNYLAWGITKRELFAAMAMQALIPTHFGATSETAVQLADSLIAELAKKQPSAPKTVGHSHDAL